MSSIEINQDKAGTIDGLKRRGLMLVFSSPSGAGKTTIANMMLELDKNLIVSTSVTTRTPRPGEKDGVDYYFVDEARFQEMIDNDELLEYAQVYDKHSYGTPRAPIEEALNSGKDVLFDIDWQGTRQLGETAPDDVVTVFVLPPSWEELENRLRKRAQDTGEEIDRRMSKAAGEISHYEEYHYVIINRDLEKSLNRVRGILEAERMKRRRLSGLEAFVDKLIPAEHKV